jgi:hypothetical protein
VRNGVVPAAGHAIRGDQPALLSMERAEGPLQSGGLGPVSGKMQLAPHGRQEARRSGGHRARRGPWSLPVLRAHRAANRCSQSPAQPVLAACMDRLAD